jgi:hypothetical protein
MTTYTTFDWTFDATFGDGKPVTTSAQARQAIVKILSDGEAFNAYRGPEPDVYKWEATTMKQKQNTTTPTVYVHRPDSDDVTRFDGNSEDMTEDETLRVSVWVLESTPNFDADDLARAYRNDILNLLKSYLRDNYENTEHQFIEPDTTTDFRPQNNNRRTDHYIYTVEVDTHRLLDAF